MERGWKPNVEIFPNCPRCGSCNTKFCYYNNYSLTQPRYFCKGCRRYWTKGGSLRNVPIGGGCRRSKRGKSIRESFDRASSRVFSYGDNTLVESTGSSGYRVLRNDHFTPGMSKLEWSNSSSNTIDLAQVYANFLNNQLGQPETRSEMTELPPSGTSDPSSFKLTNVSSSTDMEYFSTTYLTLENGLVECSSLSNRASEMDISDGGAIYHRGFNSVHGFSSDHHIISNNYGLPPLPGEEVVAPNMVRWPNSEITVPNHILHDAQMPGAQIEQEAQNNTDHFIGHKSSFDISSYGTLFMP